MNDQILREPQDIDAILQRDQKGLLELYFLSFGSANDFAKQLEKLFNSLDEIEKNEKWINILSYAMSRDVMLHWEDNPKLKPVLYCDDNKEKGIRFSDSFKRYFSEIGKGIKIGRGRLLDIINSNENSYRGKLKDRKSFLIPDGVEKFGNACVLCITAQDLLQSRV